MKMCARQGCTVRFEPSRVAGGTPMVVSFAANIRRLCCDSPDIDSMKEYGLDLSSDEDVRAQASAIFAR
jgi:hypothetical protein